MADRPLGIVVVGLGVAGKVRVRDLKQKVLGESAVLRGVISRYVRLVATVLIFRGQWV